MIKKENDKNKLRKRQDKARRKEERKSRAGTGSGDMIAYVDEFGNLSSTPPDPAARKKIDASEIMLGVPKREPAAAFDFTRTGIVTMFNASKGYGFIKDLATQESIFTHVNDHLEEIHENDRVTFRVTQSHKGLNAMDVKKAAK
jgi:cold shock CspA family protein